MTPQEDQEFAAALAITRACKVRVFVRGKDPHSTCVCRCKGTNGTVGGIELRSRYKRYLNQLAKDKQP